MHKLLLELGYAIESLTKKQVFILMLTFMAFFFIIFDCIIRGPLYQIEKQMDNIRWMRSASWEIIDRQNKALGQHEKRIRYLEDKIFLKARRSIDDKSRK